MKLEGHPNAVSDVEQERLRYVGAYYKTRKGRFVGTYIGDRLLPQIKSTLCSSNGTPLLVQVMNVALHPYSGL